MQPSTSYISKNSKLPNSLVYATIVICILPFLFNLLGIDFGSSTVVFKNGDPLDSLFHSLAGAFTHTILEWSAFCTAIFTVILALFHFRVKGDTIVPVIAVALCCAGFMDAFHTLAADRLISAQADNTDLVPFTWAICRLFNAIIMLAGCAILISRKDKPFYQNLIFISITTLSFIILAYIVVHYCAVSETLPQTMFKDSLITRPWDVGPLVLFLVSGIWVFPYFYKKHPSIFLHSLIISTIPSVATQLHMAFGSTNLFDNHFNIAHFLKIISYLVPFAGLMFDYVETFKEKNRLLEQIDSAKRHAEFSERAMKNIFETAADAIITIDEDGMVLRFNKKAETVLGYDREEVLGKNIKMLMPEPYSSEHDGYLDKYMSTGSSISAGGIIGSGRELVAKKKDGSIFPIHLSVSASDLDDEKIFTGIIRDLSEAKAMEKLLAERAEDLKDSNEELKQFAYIASHDLKAPLRAVETLTSWIEEDLEGKLEEETQKNMDLLKSRVGRMSKLIDGLLQYSRVGKKKFEAEEIDLKEFFEEVVDLMSPPEGFRVEFNDTLPILNTQRPPFEQVIRNLIDNAIKHHHNKTKGLVEILVEEGKEFFTITVKDNGPGIPKDLHEKAFQIFQTLKPRDEVEGSGMGLALIDKIIKNAGGKLSLDSDTGEGASFCFTWPVSKKT